MIKQGAKYTPNDESHRHAFHAVLEGVEPRSTRQRGLQHPEEDGDCKKNDHTGNTVKDGDDGRQWKMNGCQR